MALFGSKFDDVTVSLIKRLSESLETTDVGKNYSWFEIANLSTRLMVCMNHSVKEDEQYTLLSPLYLFI